MRGFKTTLELKIFKRASTSLLCALEMTEVEPIIVKRVNKKKNTYRQERTMLTITRRLEPNISLIRILFLHTVIY